MTNYQIQGKFFTQLKNKLNIIKFLYIKILYDKNQLKIKLSENKYLYFFLLLTIEIYDQYIYISSRSNQTEQTMKRQMSAKPLRNGCSKQEIKAYFLHSYCIYEKLFSFIKDEKNFYTKPQPLRHPLIFYYGHTAVLYINKLFDKGLISQRVNPKFESIFAVGVDEMDWDDLNDEHYDWPAVREVTAYREKVKNVILDVIQKCNPHISWDSDAWILMMGIEHQKIHLQTSSVIIRRLPVDQIRLHPDFIECPKFAVNLEQIPKNQLKQVPSFKYQLDRQRKNARVYGWDNEFGQKFINVKAYKASSMLVSNGQYLQFVEQQGYERSEFWDEEGQAWLKSIKPKMPLFWSKKNGIYELRTMSKMIPLPVNWPVEVNNLQATAFCNWKSTKVNKKLRLPTEDQYYAMRALFDKDLLEWQHGQAGNINMEYWFSPNPVNLFKIGDFYDIVGNVWQHCSTPIYPFEDFQFHPIYEDFSTPTFDGRHAMIKGGSFVSTGNQALKHARYAFRRHFYQFAGFRYVQSVNNVCNNQLLDQCDQVVEKFLKIQYLTPQSYVQKVNQVVKKYCQDKNEKCLNVGCSVGRVVLEMSKYFQQSYGTDYSARFFQMATRLYDKSYLKYKDIEISLDNLNIQKQKVILYQMNPQNPDPKKINGFSVVIIDGLALKDNTISKVLKSMKIVLSKKAKILIINKQNKNKIKLDDLQTIFDQVYLIQTWIVPQTQHQNFSVQINLYQIEQN